jgi:hypothetical protein
MGSAWDRERKGVRQLEDTGRAGRTPRPEGRLWSRLALRGFTSQQHPYATPDSTLGGEAGVC